MRQVAVMLLGAVLTAVVGAFLFQEYRGTALFTWAVTALCMASAVDFATRRRR